MMRDRVFISYSNEDEKWLKLLRKHLNPFEKKGLFVWSDRDIRPGQEWLAEIDESLDRVKVAVLLVSADFLYSDFIQNQELPRFLKAAELNQITILPVLISDCAWKVTEIVKFQSPFNPKLPLNSLVEHERDEALVIIARKINEAWENPVWSLSLPENRESSAALKAIRQLPAQVAPTTTENGDLAVPDTCRAGDSITLLAAIDQLADLLADSIGKSSQRDDIMRSLKLTGHIGRDICRNVDRRDSPKADYQQILQTCIEYQDQGSIQLMAEVCLRQLGSRSSSKLIDNAFKLLMNIQAPDRSNNG
jgi:hypothetical protein